MFKYRSLNDLEEIAVLSPDVLSCTCSDIVAQIYFLVCLHRKKSFTLEEIDIMYMIRRGHYIPYRSFGMDSLKEFLERRCDFLAVTETAYGAEVSVKHTHFYSRQSSPD